MSDELDFEASSGNVFEDMGLPNAEERLAKAKLVSKIIDIAKKKGLNQNKVATILEIDQPKISALYCGRLAGFSIARLIKFLMRLEQDVEISVKDKSVRSECFGHLTVVFNS